MKRIITFFLAALMLFALCACDDTPSGEGENTPTEASLKADYSKLFYVSGDVKFGIGDKSEEVMAKLGEPMDTFESESCAYQGKDYFYYYDGFELMANDFDGTQLITGITLDDDTVQLPQGVKVGMDIDEALSLMDVEYTQSGSVYKFTEGSTILRIRAGEDNTVAAVEFCTAAAE